MMKKQYEAPEAEVEMFTLSTVFTDLSGQGGGLGEGDNEGEF